MSESKETTAGRPSYGDSSIARDLGEQYRELHQTETVDLERGDLTDAQVLVVPAGRKVVSAKPFLDEYLEKPERRTGTAKAYDLASFIKIVNRFATGQSAVFADPAEVKPTLTAVFDYHPRNAAPAQEGTEMVLDADWLKHRAVYAPELTEEWQEWLKFNGETMGQVAFAEFIEDHATNLVVANLDDPKLKTYADLVQGRFADPTQLIQLSRSLEVNVGIKARSSVRLSSGEISVLWDEVHNDGQGEPIKVPNLFQIQVQVFKGGEWFRIAAKLRYRVSQGVMTWSYDLVQPELALRAAIEAMVESVRDQTVTSVFLGAPEA